MTIESDIRALSALAGIQATYHDLHGAEQTTSLDTQRALLTANGIDVSSDASARDALSELRHARDARWFPEEIIIEAHKTAPQTFGLGAEWHLRRDGAEGVVATGAPSDVITLPPLEPDIYVLTATASGRTETITVLAAPRKLPSIAELTGQGRMWGMTLALYGVRSARNAGQGDFEDLARIAESAGGKGAGFVGVNPLHDMGYGNREAISPYSPSHRGFLNTSYIAADQVMEGSAAPYQALRRAETVQYADQRFVHHAQLERLFSGFMDHAPAAQRADFEIFKTQGGAELARFAGYEAQSDRYGADWRHWPARPGAPDPARVAFHMWLQFVADTQLAGAQRRATAGGMPLGLYLDLAVGPRRDGAESWCEQDAVAQGVSIGAPPDHLSPAGQNWNLTAYAPRKMKALRYAPLRRVLAHTMKHAGILRIDHVLGLNRSFWIPDDGSPGGYIHQPFEALMAVIKIEALRNNCAVIGEDLGLVPEGFRDTMRASGFYGYSVLQYERTDAGIFRAPDDIPEQVLSCFATHDTPTVRGFEHGRDIDWWHTLGWVDDATAKHLHGARAEDVASIKGDGDFAHNVHARLAYSPAALVAVQLDDVLDAQEAQNLPGTIDEHPNWRRKYDTPLEKLTHHAGLQSIADVMADAGRSCLKKERSHADQDPTHCAD